MTQLMCLICHTVRKTEEGMFNHLNKKHAETMRGHLRIIDNFTCEEGSVLWNKITQPTKIKINCVTGYLPDDPHKGKQLHEHT